MDENSIKRIRGYNLFNDAFMTAFFQQDKRYAEVVIQKLMNNDTLKVESVQTQYEIKNISGGRSVRLDVYAKDATGKAFNIEIQKQDEGATPQRARLYGSFLDTHYT